MEEYAKQSENVTNPHPIYLPRRLQCILYGAFNRNTLATSAVLFAVFMMSGKKWTQFHQNDVLYYENDAEYISRDFIEQFEEETYIVMILLIQVFASIGSLIILIEGAALRRNNMYSSILKTIFQCLGISMFYIFFLLLKSIFKLKLSNYIF